MPNSILQSTKKSLGIDFAYTAFDPELIMFINSAFPVLTQLGIGPPEGFAIEDDNTDWDDYNAPPVQLNYIKTYIFLKVKLLFDPPGTSYLIEAVNKQIAEAEWRLSAMREAEVSLLASLPIEEI